MSGREIKHIVAALDGSSNANEILDESISLAKIFDAKITGIYVLGIQPTLTDGHIDPSVGQKAEKIMLSLKEHCEKKGTQFEFKIPYGKPSSEIAKFAEKEKADLIVVGSKGIGGFKGKVLGSVANSILHDSKVSVFLVK